MEFDRERAEQVMRDALATLDNTPTPLFYALTGSHLYGFDDMSSDVDIRGFHMVPAERYAYLDQPQEELVVNMDGTTEGFEAFEEIDFKSYSLRKFGSLLRKANYTVIELVCSGEPVFINDSMDRPALQTVIQSHLPMNVPHSYVGLAKKYYNRDIARADEYARPKDHLYAYRGLIAAEYVVEHNSIEPNIRRLAEAVSTAETGLVDDLIAAKRNDGMTAALHERSAARISERLDTIDLPNAGDKTAYSNDLDEWMRAIRSA